MLMCSKINIPISHVLRPLNSLRGQLEYDIADFHLCHNSDQRSWHD